MSASEKLKALDASMNVPRLLASMNFYFGPGARTLTSREDVERYKDAAKTLRALPQIVAVVEAAEQRSDIDYEGLGLDAALIALEEALS